MALPMTQMKSVNFWSPNSHTAITTEETTVREEYCMHFVVAEFLQMAVNFEECRKKWLKAGDELVSCKEMLAKAETERGALEVKLKHARNQVDVEIRRRQKAEAVYEKLVSAYISFVCTMSMHLFGNLKMSTLFIL